MVDDDGRWVFPKLSEEYTLHSGQGIMYKNSHSENERDKQMIHKIHTNNGIIANIYVREKNVNRETLDIIEEMSDDRSDDMSDATQINQPIIHPITSPINYMDIYDEVIQAIIEWVGG